mmetsp:Transcript_995/g.2129  ORF Transcript_995/g.2129 Transcript_995/m.2129 type:complete len:356 (-) Transcript_995:1534-2601(-)
MATSTAVVTQDVKREQFLEVFADLVRELDEDLANNYDLPEYAKVYIHRNMVYNVPHGKLTRGLAVVECVKAFWEGSGKGDMSPELTHSAQILGWCVEFLQAFFLVADDIMDGSLTRRGQPCFFRLPEIGLKAINDSLMLEMMIFRMLRRHLKGEEYYIAVVELFQDMTYTTEVGQLLDLTSQGGEVDLSKFNEETLYRIYRYKTCYYSFYLSVALGMIISGVQDEKLYSTAKEICLAIGEYFQAQDDMLDCFGNPEVTGKVGTDIEENKCTWLSVEAMKVATEDDKDILLKNYGRNDVECVAAVKDLYRRLMIPEKFEKYEGESYSRISEMISAVQGMPTGAFVFLLNKVYKRKK